MTDVTQLRNRTVAGEELDLDTVVEESTEPFSNIRETPIVNTDQDGVPRSGLEFKGYSRDFSTTSKTRDFVRNLIPSQNATSDDVPSFDYFNSYNLRKILFYSGHIWFKLKNFDYKAVNGTEYLTAEVNYNDSIPIEIFLKAMPQTHRLKIEDLENQLRAFGDTVDLTDPNVRSLIPGFEDLRDINGRYFVMKDPYMLLLGLDVDDREFVANFITSAIAHNDFSPSIKSPWTTSSGKWYKLSKYAMTRSDVESITHHPHFTDSNQVETIRNFYDLEQPDKVIDFVKDFRDYIRGELL